MEMLLRCEQQMVETVILRGGVGQAPASLHHRVKIVDVFALERDEQCDDGVPGVGAPRPYQVAAHFTLRQVGARLTVHLLVSIDDLVVALLCRFECAGIKDTQVTGEAEDHDVFVERGNRARGHRLSGVDQHFNPFAEAADIELFVAPGLRVTPQIQVEQRRELRGCGRRDELAAGMEPLVLNELVQSRARDAGPRARAVDCREGARDCRGSEFSTWAGDDTRPARPIK